MPIPLRLVGGLALLILAGTGLLLLPGMTWRPLTPMEAFFTATSAVTVTGLSVIPTSTSFTPLGQVVLLLLIQTGGVGFITLIVLALHLLGRNIPLADRLALTSAMRLEKPGRILNVLRKAILFMFIIEGVGAALLYVHWKVNGIAPPDRVGFYALFHAVSAFCNAGFDLFAGLPSYPDGLPNDNISLIILGLLVFMGGLGIPVMMELTAFRQRKRVSLHTWLTLITTAMLILLGWIGLFLAEYVKVRGVVSGMDLSNALVQTWFQSISTRTAGFPGLHSFSLVGPDSRLLIISLMFIGSAPASMGGGITTGAFAVLALVVWNYIRGFRTVQVRHRTISQTTVIRAVVVLLTSLSMVLIASWLILLTHRFSFNKALFEVVSALATCGLSMGITEHLNTFGRLVIIAMMFFGRAGVTTLLLALVQREHHSRRQLTFPEEDVLVG
jgi:trk system potassium uptake protein TrkH